MQYSRKLNEVNGDFIVMKHFGGYLRRGAPPNTFYFHKLLQRNFLLFALHSTPVNLNALQLSVFFNLSRSRKKKMVEKSE